MAAVKVAQDELAEFCRKHRVRRLSFFGSVLRDDFGPESDIDILISFDRSAHHGLFDLGYMEKELADILGRKVDLVTRRGIESSDNRIRRDGILGSAEVIYVA